MLVSRSGLVTVTGGKWTTYRAMAEDVLVKCQQAGLGGIRLRPAHHRLVGAPMPTRPRCAWSEPNSASTMAQKRVLQALPGAGVDCPHLSEAMVLLPRALSTPARWKMCWPGATGFVPGCGPLQAECGGGDWQRSGPTGDVDWASTRSAVWTPVNLALAAQKMPVGPVMLVTLQKQ